MQNTIKVAFLIIFLTALSCKNKTHKTESNSQETPHLSEEKKEYTKEISVYDFNALQALLHQKNDTTYLVNFWAMWCAPCVKELPYFEGYALKNKEEKTKVIFVSLDFKKDIETRLKPFLSKKNITSEVVLFDPKNTDGWMKNVDPNWSGGLPFTIIYNAKEREFYERTFESIEDIEKTVQEFTTP